MAENYGEIAQLGTADKIYPNAIKERPLPGGVEPTVPHGDDKSQIATVTKLLLKEGQLGKGQELRQTGSNVRELERSEVKKVLKGARIEKPWYKQIVNPVMFLRGLFKRGKYTVESATERTETYQIVDKKTAAAEIKKAA